MAKSLGNYVGVTESPEEIYGKTLSIPDGALPVWYTLLLGTSAPAEQGPRDAKHALAGALVERFHGPDAARAAAEHFERVIVQGGIPQDVPSVDWPRGEGTVHLPALLARAFGVSTSEARRALTQGGVRLDGEPVENGSLDVDDSMVEGKVLQLGKRRFARVNLN
jgi:tyrosyl-tRNA synthetase